MENKEQIWYTVPDYQGYPTRVRASMVEEFLEEQERLKANPPSKEETMELALQMLADLEAETGIKGPEEDNF
jgi:hypothetical protein